MKANFKPEDVEHYECIHATYHRCQNYSGHDLVLVKEHVHLKDGTIVPNVRMVEDYKRHYWITRDGFQTHTDKKEWEDVARLKRSTSTQANLEANIARALNKNIKGARLSMLSRSPYLYGSDITSTTLIKHRYMENAPDVTSVSSSAVLDVETNTVRKNLTDSDLLIIENIEDKIARQTLECDRLERQIKESDGEILLTTKEKAALQKEHETIRKSILRKVESVKEISEQIISGSLTMGSKAFLAVSKCWLRKHGDVTGDLQTLFEKYLGKYKKERDITLEVEIVDNDAEITKALLAKAHEWKPDFIAIWFINFDIPKLVQSLQRHGIDPAQVFSDPSVPDNFKSFRYKEAQQQKTTATGKITTKHYCDLWHVVHAPASFYFVDAMCLYKLVRVTEPMQPSYSLDSILGINLDLGKLRFEEADQYTGVEWHQVMQTNHQLEYLIYNVFDCIGVELLEEKNRDLTTLRMLVGHSDLDRFTSTPRRLADDLHFVCLEDGKVMGSTSDEMVDELDKQVVPMTDWMNECHILAA